MRVSSDQARGRSLRYDRKTRTRI